MPPKRYFAVLEEEQTCKPGVISDSLRTALDIHHDKLPIWIYRMRVLGYPPGWLKKADMTKTVVPLIDGESQADEQDEPQERTYNVESFVTYPGFNAPVPNGVEDDWRLLRMPPLQHHQQLNVAAASVKRPKPVPYKRIRISSPDDSNDDKSSNDVNDDSHKNEEEIEAQKLKRLELLEKAKNNTVDEFERSRVRLVAKGVPLPSTYMTKKPPLENWSENNTLPELIYFENLPNSTGTFDKMRSIIGSVRKKLFSNQSNDLKVKSTTETQPTTSKPSDEEMKISSGENNIEIIDIPTNKLVETMMFSMTTTGKKEK